MTTYRDTSASDVPQFHDILRLTFAAPSHWFESADYESQLLAADLDWLAAGYTDATGRSLGVVPVSPNPVTSGVTRATVDFLVLADPANTSMAAIVQHLEQAALAQHGSTIETVQKVVGGGAIAAGSPAEYAAIFDTQGAAGRQAAQDAAAAAAAAQQSWLDKLEAQLGTVGKYAAIGAAGLLALWILAQLKAAKRVVSP